MKNLLLFSATLLTLTATAQVSAFDDFETLDKPYFGISSAFIDIDISGRYREPPYTNVPFKGSLNGATNLGAIAGFQFNKFISSEARGYFGIKEAEKFGEEVKISKSFGFYAKPTLPLHEYFTVYGLLGYNRITAKSNGESDSESDMSYGIGFEVNKGTNVKLHVEWLVLHDDNYNFQWLDNSRIDYNLKISSINANLSWYF